MGSTRTPGKVLKEFSGQPMLWHQIQRVKLAKSLSKIIVATTNQPEDQAIVELAKSAGVAWSTGSTDDVLDRVYQAAKDSNAEVVIRITGDCPLIDPTVIDKVVGHYLANIDELDHVFLGPD
jgi:spore coat polysaccharide biosynthesis protein SpsF (cytidylyltransferase family)